MCSVQVSTVRTSIPTHVYRRNYTAETLKFHTRRMRWTMEVFGFAILHACCRVTYVWICEYTVDSSYCSRLTSIGAILYPMDVRMIPQQMM